MVFQVKWVFRALCKAIFTGSLRFKVKNSKILIECLLFQLCGHFASISGRFQVLFATVLLFWKLKIVAIWFSVFEVIFRGFSALISGKTVFWRVFGKFSGKKQDFWLFWEILVRAQLGFFEDYTDGVKKISSCYPYPDTTSGHVWCWVGSSPEVGWRRQWIRVQQVSRQLTWQV